MEEKKDLVSWTKRDLIKSGLVSVVIIASIIVIYYYPYLSRR